MRKKVLIYVQAYNAEKTLERCLKSIEMQTYKEFECVIYDNGSKDDTEKIANRFSEKDGRFIVVHRDENDTTLFFRYFVPLFVEKYTGIIDYFCNLDSDDEYKADFLEKSITFLEKNELDLVASGGDFIDANTGKCVSKREVEQDLIIEDENFGSYFPIYHQFMRTIWGKLYRFSLLGKIDCERCMCMGYGGDTFFVFNILHFCKRIGIMNKNLHKYYMSLKSRSYTFSEKRIESDTKLLQEAITFLVYKVGYVSPMNQNFLMQVYKNAISDTIEVLFDSTEKVETKHYLLCKILDDFCTKLLIQKMWFDKEFADLFIKIASLMVADSQIVEEHYADIARLLAKMGLFVESIKNVDKSTIFLMQVIIRENWYNGEFPLQNETHMLDEAKEMPYFQNISRSFLKQYGTIIGMSMSKKRKCIALNQVMDIFMGDEKIVSNCLEELLQLGINLSAELEQADRYVYLEKEYIRYLITNNQVGKAQNELQDWNEILPEDQDFKRMRELIENE